MIALGGDNSATYAVAQGAAATGLITIDAHFDLRDGVSNGSPCAGSSRTASTRGGSCSSASPTSRTPSPTPGARRTAASPSSPSTTCAAAAPPTSPREALEVAGAGGGGIHLDIDVDVCDRSVAPGCPASVPGGLAAWELRALVRALARDPRLASADIVEVDATADAADGRTVRLAALCVLELLAGKAVRSMIRLALVRHAKSDWGDPRLDDHDRPLNDRGLRDAPRMARRLAETGFRPDVILSSTALRARTTAEAFGAELGVAVSLDPELYGAPARTLLAAPRRPARRRSWSSRTTPA